MLFWHQSRTVEATSRLGTVSGGGGQDIGDYQTDEGW